MPLEGRDLEAFLQEAHLAHFATNGPDGNPRVRPIWFCYANGAFWFTTRIEARQTGADVASGSPVAVSIASERRPYLAVIAYGSPEIWKQDRKKWLERIATRYGEAEGKRWLNGALKEPDRVVLRLVPDKAVAWHYGRGDYARMQRKESLRVTLTLSHLHGGASSVVLLLLRHLVPAFALSDPRPQLPAQRLRNGFGRFLDQM